MRQAAAHGIITHAWCPVKPTLEEREGKTLGDGEEEA